MDDYSLLLILTSLLIIEQRPELCEQYTNGENLLFDPQRIFTNECPAYARAREIFAGQAIIDRLLKLLKSPSPRIETLKGLSILLGGLRPHLRDIFHLTVKQAVPAVTDSSEQFFDDNGRCGYLFDNGKGFIDPVFDDGDTEEPEQSSVPEALERTVRGQRGADEPARRGTPVPRSCSCLLRLG